MNLNLMAHGDPQKVEEISRILYEIQESFSHFCHPFTGLQKVGEQFDKLSEAGVFDIILDHISQYAEVQTQVSLNQFFKHVF